MKNKIMTASVAGLLSIVTCITPVFASESETTNVTDEMWGKPTVVYGGGLNDSQVQQIADKFGIKDRSTVLEMRTTADDITKYLGYNTTTTSSLISCVEVQKTKKGSGVRVEIKTPSNITQITNTQYANAAITAGVSDVNISVASLTPATGESALSGVYKALEANGETVDTERSQVAQDELETTNEIAQDNADNDSFNSNNLDQAMIDIKSDLADLKKQQGEVATTEQVQDIVNKALEKYNLSDILSQDDISKLIDFAKKYQNTSAIDSKEVVSQLKKLSGGIKNFIDSGQAQGWLDKFVSWFKSLFGWS